MLEKGFPEKLSEEVLKVRELLYKKVPKKEYSVSEDLITYYINSEQIKFPYRVYFSEIKDELIEKLNNTQKMILHCIYTRNHNGYVREKHLRALLENNYNDWTIPYIIKLSDEYVTEILETIYKLLKDKDTKSIKKFCLENVKSFCLSYYRMTSYWNCFYRDRCYYFKDYIGKKLFEECFGYTKSMRKL